MRARARRDKQTVRHADRQTETERDRDRDRQRDRDRETERDDSFRLFPVNGLFNPYQNIFVAFV